MGPVPTVLYADARAVATKFFGPHELLCACTADRTGDSLFALRKRLIDVPSNGIGPLLARVGRVAHQFEQYPMRLMILIDHDRIREHVRLPALACRTQVVSTVRGSRAFAVVLLEENTEDLLRAARQILGGVPLTGKPTPLERDRILENAAHATTLEQRQAILARCPSFGRLVTAAVAALDDSDG